MKFSQFLALILSFAASIISAATVADSIRGREFCSSKVVVDGKVRDLVPGTRIIIRFDDKGGFSAYGGCNHGGGPYSISDGDNILLEKGMLMTQRGCGSTALHDQEYFIVRFCSSQPKVEVLDDDRIVLRTDSTIITFVDRVVVDPDRPLVGTKWDAIGFFDSEFAHGMFMSETGWIHLLPDGKLSFFDGRTEHHDGIYTVSETDHTITFSNVELSTCDDESDEHVRRYTTKFHTIFDTNTVVTYGIKGPNLDIQTANGTGVSFRASVDDPSATASGFLSFLPKFRGGIGTPFLKHR